MIVRFLKDWHYFKRGTVTEWLNMRTFAELSTRGIVEEVETAEAADDIETAAVRLDKPKRKRGRPRKVQV